MAITDYRIEAWTNPAAGGTFEKVVASVPWTAFAFGKEINGVPQNTIALSAEFDRLSDIHDPETNTETLLRCFKRDGKEIGNCIVRDGFREYRESTEITLTGPGIEEELQWSIVYPYDWVNETTEVKQPDWEWGNPNTFLDNPGFEDGEQASTGWESGDLEGWKETSNSGGYRKPDSVTVLNDAGEARNGNFVVQIDANIRHSGIRKSFDCDPNTRYTFTVWLRSATIGERLTAGMTVSKGYTVHHTNGFVYNGLAMAELGNVARNPAANGLPGGSTDGTWQSIMIDVTTGDEQERFDCVIQYDHHDGGNGPIFFVDDFSISGGTIGFEPWYQVGTGTTLSLNQVNVHEGDNSMEVITGGNGVNADGLWQGTKDDPIEGFEIGVTYTLGFWVYHELGSPVDFTAVISAAAASTWLASAQVSVPNATWTFVAVLWTADQTTARISLQCGNPTTMTFYVDNTSMAVGFVATTLGDVLTQLLTPIKARGSLTWLKTDSWSVTTDSAGVLWEQTHVTIRVNRGRDMRQTLDLMSDYGMEWEVIWNDVASQYELKVYDNSETNQGLGADRTGDADGKLHAGGGLVNVRIMRASPGANQALAEGESFIFAEDSDLTLRAAFGRRETYEGNASYMESPKDVAKYTLQRQWRRYEVRATIVDIDGQDVWDKYEIGNLYNVQLPPDISANEELRVHSMMITANQQTDLPRTVVTLRREKIFV